MSDTYAASLHTDLLTPLRAAWNTTALPLSEFEWLNAALLVRQRQRSGKPRPLFVALPAYADKLGSGLRAATAAAWLAGHEAPAGPGGGLPLKAADHVFHDGDVWQVKQAPDATGRAALTRYRDGRGRAVAATECRKLVAPFEFADLLNPQKKGLAGSIYLKYLPWLERLQAGVKQARQVFGLADPDGLPRPHGGHTILLVPTELRYPGFEEAVLSQLTGAPTQWRKRWATAADSWNLPFAASLHVVSSLAEAVEVRKLRPGITAWHLSVVGKRAVGNALRVAQLVHAYDQGQWASLSFWGPDLGVGETPGCEVWPWTRTEARRPQAPPDPVRLVVAPLAAPVAGAASLPNLVAAVRGILLGLSQPITPGQQSVRLPTAWNLLHRCLRYTLPPGAASPASRRYLAELSHQVAECLAADELVDAFMEAGRSWPVCKAASQQLQAAFTELIAYYQQHSPKYDRLCAIVAEAQEDERPVLIASDRESLTAAQACWQGTAGVTVLPLLGTSDNLRRRLLDQQLTAATVVAVPFLFNRDQLALLQTAPGTVCLVLLAEVEEGLYGRTLASQRQQELAQLQASGRAALLGKTYEQLAGLTTTSSPVTARTAAPADEQLDYFAELYAVGDARYAGERQRGRASGQLFVFSFADGYRTELDGHTRLLRREEAEWLPTQADQVEAGQVVLFYENDQQQLIETILRQHDSTGLIERIDQASQLWRYTLKRLASRYRTTGALYHDLCEYGAFDAEQQTLQAYLDGRRRFPGAPATLHAIKYLAIHHNLLNCELLAPGAVGEIDYCRSKFQQLAVALGKGLSDEVLRYRLTGTAGQLLASLAPDVRELVLLSAVERTVRDVRRK